MSNILSSSKLNAASSLSLSKDGSFFVHAGGKSITDGNGTIELSTNGGQNGHIALRVGKSVSSDGGGVHISSGDGLNIGGSINVLSGKGKVSSGSMHFGTGNVTHTSGNSGSVSI